MVVPVDDMLLDDSIYINIADNVGIITGCNPRSVLISAYRFLHPADLPEYPQRGNHSCGGSFRIRGRDCPDRRSASFRWYFS